MTRYYIQKILKTLAEKLLELINEPNKVAGHKINIQKSVVSIHKQTIRKKIKKIISFRNAPKGI